MNIRSLITNIVGVLILVTFATGLSVAALAKPSLNWNTATAPTTAPTKPAPAPTPMIAPVPAVATPTPAPVPAAPTVKTAVTNGFVHLRASASTSSDILADLQAGTTVTLLTDQNSLWQQVQYQNLTGYVYKSYLTY